jgi:glycosyltransferase involved in cell wall biosynthesis/peptidoglycan/xylan/chitin deacetylase (PgdA/CDA1 family)
VTVRFSIVIPTHQRRERVLRTVAALSDQEGDDFEVVVVNDGSTDGTADALRTLSVPFALTVIEQGNRGAAAARNAGAEAARGEILLFLDDDMEAHPSLLVEHDRSLREGADLVLGDLPLHPESPANVLSAGVGSWASSRRDRLAARPDDIPLADLLTGQLSIARDAFERMGGFDVDLTRDGLFGGEDVDFGYRVLKAGYRVRFNPEAISYQYFDVDPAEFLRREYEAGRGAQELALKHPERAEQLAGIRGLEGRRRRWLLGPLAIAPRAFSWPLRASVASLVRSGRGGERLQSVFQAVRAMEHVRGARAARRALETEGVAVLVYHAIADLSHDSLLRDYGVSPKRFAEHLDALTRWGWTFVDLDAVLAAFSGSHTLPRRSVLLTFDDAYADLAGNAMPVMMDRGVPAVVFAVADQVGGVNEWDVEKGGTELKLLDADGLRTLAEGGVEIGSHAASHRPLTRVPPDQLPAELEGSAARLEAMGLPRPRALSYPHGDTNAAVAAVAESAGYAIAFTVRPGIARRGVDPLAVPRVEVLAGDTPSRLRLKLATVDLPASRWRARALRLLRGRGRA